MEAFPATPAKSTPAKPAKTAAKPANKHKAPASKKIKVEIPVKRGYGSEEESEPEVPDLLDDTESDEELNLSDHDSDVRAC
jgi:hypothetical protein